MLKFFLLFLLFSPTFSINVTCEFSLEEFRFIGEIHVCTSDTLVEINSKNTEISFLNSTEPPFFANSQVQGVKFEVHQMKFFPQSITKTFPNLIAIYINDGILSEIHQSDLQPFPQLRYLDLFENHLEVIEADLFKFNQNLELIWLSNNRIRLVDPNVFNHLTKLSFLYMMENECIQQSETNRTQVLKLIENVKQKCSVSSVRTTTVKPFIPKTNNGLQNEFLEASKKLKECEENIFVTHTMMEAMTLASEFQNVAHEDEIQKIRRTKNILWFFVVILTIFCCGLLFLTMKRKNFDGIERNFLIKM